MLGRSHFIALAFAAVLGAAPAHASGDAHGGGDAAVAQAFLSELRYEQNIYTMAKGSEFFNALAKGQTPRATVVTCSDSRVHTNMLDKSPEGDLFMIRNIGNQLETAHGSVQYGVNHLNSSLLLFIGHSRCGAIAAASTDHSSLEWQVQKELDSIHIGKGVANIDGVKTNVNNQVSAAMKEWGDKVKSGRLMIVGAVYDFADDMKQGAGKLNIININGETDPAKLRNESVQAAKSTPAAKDAHH